MNKKIDALRIQRNTVARAQGDVQGELLANSIDPQRTAFLMHQLMICAVEQYELTQSMALAAEEQKKPFMVRLFGS